MRRRIGKGRKEERNRRREEYGKNIDLRKRRG
jgi:hypothetical protein